MYNINDVSQQWPDLFEDLTPDQYDIIAMSLEAAVMDGWTPTYKYVKLLTTQVRTPTTGLPT